MSGTPWHQGWCWDRAADRVSISKSPYNYLNQYELTDEERCELEERKRRGVGFEPPKDDDD